MHIDEFAGLEDLEALRSTKSAAPAKPRETFPCVRCGGSGIYRGTRIHQEETRCFSCGGRGHHLKPYAHAMADKAQAKAKREDGARRAANARQLAFEAQHPGLREWMSRQEWSGFLQDMVQQIRKPAGLTERQLAAVLAAKAKSDARQVERTAAKAAASVEVSLATVETMFDKARAKGLRKLAYRARGLVISPAKETGTNPGAIYVKSDSGTYLGKVVGGKFQARWEATEEHKASLLKIAADPAGEARDYGKETGKCCCCGRELTDPDSIAAGIGPICAEGWGF